jgi:diacylglycerol kinase (ATP)
LVSRVRNYGGDLEIAPTISLLDDEFEMVLFEGESSFGFLKYMLAVVVHQQRSMRGITIVRTRHAVFPASQNSNIHVQVDGEYAGLTPAQVELVPNALTLLVPPGFRARRPASVPTSVSDAAWTTSPTR